MQNHIAIDGGGTKTQAVLFREDGHILCQKRYSGTNPLDVGVENARKILLTAIRDIRQTVQEPIGAVYAGVAGLYYFDDFFPDNTCDELDCKSLCIETDGRSLISSELYHQEDGCCLIVGTGCGTWIRQSKNDGIFHVGGWGYLVDALGSGYSLGREIVRAVCLAYDGRGERTVLSDLLQEETKLPLRSSIPYLYAGGRARFASLAHLIFEGKQMGDRVCHEIIEEGASKLAELIWTADQYFSTEYKVVMGGGIVTNFPEYAELIRIKSPNRANMILATVPPVFGAAVEAMRQNNTKLPTDFRENFIHDLDNV